MTQETKTLSAFAAFALNYPMNFVREAFAEDGNRIIDHLEIKFIEQHQKHGGYGAMIAFWSELSQNNRETLTKYILNQKS